MRTGHKRFDDLIDAAEPEAYTAPTVRDDMAFWLYTSGSTGKPKGAVHVHAEPRSSPPISTARRVVGLNENDVCYSVAKLFFAYGLGNAMTFPMSVGATTVLHAERPTPDGVAALLRKHPVTVFFAVPTFYAAFLESPSGAAKSRSQAPPLHFRRRGAAGGDRRKRWHERYGVDISDGLGTTEMLHIYLTNAPGATKYGTTGSAVAGYEIKLIDDDGAAGEAGRDGRAASARADQRASCTGTTARSRARPSRASGRARATNTSRTPTAITSAAAAPTTC